MYNSQYLFTINFITLAGIFYIISVLLLGYKVVDLIPSYKSSIKDKEEHSQAIDELNKSIEIIEEKHNGLIWRLHDALIKHDPAIDTETNKNLVRLSKEQSFASLANQYRDYIKYINEAKVLNTCLFR